MQIACYKGYYKIVAILWAESRTIPNFTTSESDESPIKISEKMMKKFPHQEEINGINHSKCVELLQDKNPYHQKSNLHKPAEVLKKFNRLNSDSKSLKFENSIPSQNHILKKLERKVQKENPIEFDIFEGEENDTIVPILNKLLSPSQLEKVPVDFLKGNYVYFSFWGTIGKQSKILKKILERKIEIDVIEGKLIEYRDVFDYPEKPYRVRVIL